MTWRNTAERWSGVSIALHWLIALLILALAIIGLSMVEMPNSLDKLKVYALHKSIGLSVLALVVLRLGWRLAAGAAPPVPGTPRWQQRVAELTHWLLYALMLAMPLSGWLYNSAANFPLRWFSLFSVPKLSGPDPVLKALAHQIHEYGFWLLAALVLLHAGAALWHHLAQRDRTLVRMLPRRLERTLRPPHKEIAS